MKSNPIDHPAHYGGLGNPYEAIKVIEAWDLGFCLGNAVKYIARLGKKKRGTELEDLKKARWYIDHEIQKYTKQEFLTICKTVMGNTKKKGESCREK